MNGLRAVNLVTAISYSGVGGAAGHPTGASMANGTYTYAASYDSDLRLQTDSLTDGATTLYGLSLGYDGVGDVASADTTLAAGTDHQAFCYDEQNQLTWAGHQRGARRLQRRSPTATPKPPATASGRVSARRCAKPRAG